MKALLFDIDGTLLDCHGLGRTAFEAAIKKVLDKDATLSSTDWMGRTDSEIITGILEQIGYPDDFIRENLGKIFQVYTEAFREFAKDNPARFEVLPGVRELLKEMKGRTVGLLTGNVKEAAHIKLDTAGIGSIFPFGIGGYGSEDRVRSNLLPIAVKRMEKYYGVPHFDEIVVIGDSHRDIDCAKVHGAVSFAVATGRQSVEELEKYLPDYALENFNDKQRVLEILCP